MVEMNRQKYPIGTQSFPELRRNGCVYVDKTRYIYEMINSGSRFYFLSRPRRFGKSLLISTIEAFFKGEKELFEGLYIYDKETEWRQYPILHFDLSGAEAASGGDLRAFLENAVNRYEKQYDVEEFNEVALGQRFGFLIENIHKKTGSQVVVLIDEYDKGVIEVLDNALALENNQQLLRPFLSQLKSQDEHIRFALLTGIARFRHYTIFSGFNNPKDISMDDRYAAICGITSSELLDVFTDGIRQLAESQNITFEEAVNMLKLKYDGYRFSDKKEYVYNPFSILNCLDSRKFGDYWLSSGTSKTFLKFLAKTDFELSELEEIWCPQRRLEGTFSTEDPIPLLFQNGYLTIRDVDDDLYRLHIPNGEVRSALVDDLMPKFLGTNDTETTKLAHHLRKKVTDGDVDGFMTLLRAELSKVPYHLYEHKSNEKTFHLLIYSFFLMSGINAKSEIAMSGGRIDMVIETPKFVYVMEFKLDGTIAEAMSQINSRGYALPWSADNRQVFKIAANFSSEQRTISEWAYTPLP